MERKGKEEKDDGEIVVCVHVYVWVTCVCGTDQTYLYSNEYTVVNSEASA